MEVLKDKEKLFEVGHILGKTLKIRILCCYEIHMIFSVFRGDIDIVSSI